MACDPDVKVNASTCFVDCAHQPCKIEPYGDIGGIGVILAFMVTAWLLVVLLAVYYITVYDYALDPFRPKGDFETLSKYPNTVDRVFLSTVRKWRLIDFSKTPPKTRKKLNKDFNKCVLAFADLQIITGIGVLVSGIRPTVCGLQAYHFQVIVHLAWFSSVTHLAALSFLRNYLVNHRRELYIRGALMGVLAGLLSGAVGVAGHFDWEGPHEFEEPQMQPSYFSRCAVLKEFNTDSREFETMVVDVLLIVYGYTIRLVKTWRWASTWSERLSRSLHRSFLEDVENWTSLEREMKASRRVCDVILRPLSIGIKRVLYLQVFLLTSYLAEVSWLAFVVLWRTIRITSHIQQHRPPAENDWAFGQVLPLMMMASPLILLCAPLGSLYWVRQPRGRQGDPVYALESILASTESPQRQLNESRASLHVYHDSRQEREGDPMFVSQPYVSDSGDLQGDLDTRDITDAGHHMAVDHGPTSPLSHADSRGLGANDDNVRFLESSSGLQGALVLCAWRYVELAMYILVGDSLGLFVSAVSQFLSVIFVSFFLQASWLTFTLFASCFPLGNPALSFDVFVTHLAALIVLSRGEVGDTAISFPMLICVYLALTIWTALIAGEAPEFSTRFPCVRARAFGGRLWEWACRYLACATLTAISLINVRAAPKFIPVPLAFHGLILSIGKIWPNLGRRAASYGIVLVLTAIGIQGWGRDATGPIIGPTEAQGGVFSGSFNAYPLFSPLADLSLWILGWAVVIGLWPAGGCVVRGVTWVTKRFFGARNVGP